MGDNKLLGQFDLVGIPPAPRGVPQIEVTFDIDANGIVNVSAKDKATNKEQNIRVQASGGLSDDEVDQMVRDAEANAEADKQRRALVEVRNGAESRVHSVDKNLGEYGDQIEEAEKSAIEADLQALKDVKDGEDVAAIEEKRFEDLARAPRHDVSEPDDAVEGAPAPGSASVGETS